MAAGAKEATEVGGVVRTIRSEGTALGGGDGRKGSGTGEGDYVLGTSQSPSLKKEGRWTPDMRDSIRSATKEGQRAEALRMTDEGVLRHMGEAAAGDVQAMEEDSLEIPPHTGGGIHRRMFFTYVQDRDRDHSVKSAPAVQAVMADEKQSQETTARPLADGLLVEKAIFSLMADEKAERFLLI